MVHLALQAGGTQDSPTGGSNSTAGWWGRGSGSQQDPRDHPPVAHTALQAGGRGSRSHQGHTAGSNGSPTGGSYTTAGRWEGLREVLQDPRDHPLVVLQAGGRSSGRTGSYSTAGWWEGLRVTAVLQDPEGLTGSPTGGPYSIAGRWEGLLSNSGRGSETRNKKLIISDPAYTHPDKHL